MIHEMNVAVLRRDEGYTAKYGLNPREFLRAQPEGTPIFDDYSLFLSVSPKATLFWDPGTPCPAIDSEVSQAG